MQIRLKYPFPLCAALVLLIAFSCSRNQSENQRLLLEQQRLDYVETARQDSLRRDSLERHAARAKPKTVQEALRADARLARTMSLEKFAQYMRSREGYYSQFKEVSYEDEYVKIKRDGDKLKIETPTGKAKFEDGESKIKTDTYKRKTETD